MKKCWLIILGLFLFATISDAEAGNRKQAAKDMAKKYVNVTNGKASVDVGKIISRTAAAAVLESTRRKAKIGSTVPDNAFKTIGTEGCPEGTKFESQRRIVKDGNYYKWVTVKGCGN